MPCLAAVDRWEQMAQKFWAPVMDRIQPETLIRSFPILISRSAALLSNGPGDDAEQHLLEVGQRTPPRREMPRGKTPFWVGASVWILNLVILAIVLTAPTSAAARSPRCGCCARSSQRPSSSRSSDVLGNEVSAR